MHSLEGCAMWDQFERKFFFLKNYYLLDENNMVSICIGTTSCVFKTLAIRCDLENFKNSGYQLVST